MGVIKQTPRRALDPSSGHTSDNEVFGDLGGTGITYTNTGTADTPDALTSLSLLNIDLNRRARHTNQRTRLRVPAIPQDTTPRHRKNGKGSTRKSRKYENQLMLIQEADEEGNGDELGEVSIEDLTFQASRTFTRFLNESSMTGLLNSFIDSPDQNILHELEKTNNIKSTKCSVHKADGSFDPGVAFLRICRKLRNILKQRHLPLGIVDSLEEGLVDFFCTHRNQNNSTYELGPLDAYRRGLLHAISQYNNLKSFSIGKKKTEKVVHVQMKPSGFEPPPVRLVAYIETKLHVHGQDP